MELAVFEPDINLTAYEWCLTLILDCELVSPLQRENSCFTLQMCDVFYPVNLLANNEFTSK